MCLRRDVRWPRSTLDGGVAASAGLVRGSARPLLIHGMNAADSRSYTPIAWGNSHTGDVLRGEAARFARHDELEIRLPPDWSAGYTSVFEHQQEA